MAYTPRTTITLQHPLDDVSQTFRQLHNLLPLMLTVIPEPDISADMDRLLHRFAGLLERPANHAAVYNRKLIRIFNEGCTLFSAAVSK